MKDIKETLKERGKRYGDFKENATIAQELKQVIHKYDDNLTFSQVEAIEVIMQKISRILTGDPSYVDNWHDLAGYAILIEQELIKNKK